METKIDLNPATIEAIQDLIQVNLDSAKGFTDAAKEVDDADLATLFIELRAHREKQAAELQYYVVLNGERPCVEGSFLAALQRIWMDVLATLRSGNAHVVLTEVLRGEDQIKAAYEYTITKTAGSALNDVLLKHFVAVKEDNDRITNLWNQTKPS